VLNLEALGEAEKAVAQFAEISEYKIKFGVVKKPNPE